MAEATKAPLKALSSLKTILDGADQISPAQGLPIAWLKSERSKARETWEQTGFPSRQNEAWKYTSVSSLTEVDWALAKPLSSSEAEATYRKSRLPVKVSGELVFVNGEFVPQLSTLSSTQGLFIGSLRSVLESGNTAVQSALENAGKVFADPAHKGVETSFASLNASLFSDAAVIVASANTVVKAPVVLSFIHSGKGNELSVSQPRVFAVFGKHSEVTVIENHVGAESYFSNNVTDGYLADEAKVTYVRVQNESTKASHIGSTRFTVSRSARLESLQLSLGAALSRQDLKIRLTAPGAEAVVDGLYIVREKQHVDNHTAIEHIVGDTQSEQLYKGILDDESRAVFNGRIFIAQDAQKSNSSQLNNNLVLSKKAEIDTKPELEIFADDVKAGHGATIGRLDPEHLFYLKSRAISESQAVSMLALGFANDLVLRRTNPLVQEALKPLIVAAVGAVKVGV